MISIIHINTFSHVHTDEVTWSPRSVEEWVSLFLALQLHERVLCLMFKPQPGLFPTCGLKHQISGIINHRLSGKLPAWLRSMCLVSVSESSCLDPHDASGGSFNLVDCCIDRWWAISPVINMLYFRSLKWELCTVLTSQCFSTRCPFNFCF